MRRIAACLMLIGLCMTIASCASLRRNNVSYEKIEAIRGKTVMIFTPHPDDDTFLCGGTLSLLAKNGNKIITVIYTSDNAGSEDPAMTHERLAAIRKAEEEDACRILGIPTDTIIWYGYDDGMLEYADKRELTKRIAREIRIHRPDIIFTIDPGKTYDQWHKSDHRTAAIVTTDAMRAAGWRLYFPEIEKEGYPAWAVPLVYFYYTADPDVTVDITSVAEAKSQANAAHFSQFGDAVKKYNPNPTQAQRDALAERLKGTSILIKDGDKYVEKFRRGLEYGQ